jgi:hypothetical protein
MRFRTLLTSGSLLAAALAVLPASAQTIVGRLGGFNQPESASYDPSTGAIYVSNINSPDFSPNGQGYISLLSPDGTVVEQYWLSGLNVPKGTSVRDGTLWVAVADGIDEIDIMAQTVRNHYPIEGAMFLNDIFAAEDGRVFVADTFASAIYVLENGTVSLFVQDPMLAGANGLTIVGNTMYVATLGDVSQGFANLQPSNIKTVDLTTKAIADYGSPAPIGGLDGIEPAAGGMMVTDNGGGRLLLVAPDGTVTTIAEVGAGAADFELVADQNFAVIPMLNTGEVLFVAVP